MVYILCIGISENPTFLQKTAGRIVRPFLLEQPFDSYVAQGDLLRKSEKP